MSLIVKLLPEAHILLDLQAGSKKRAFEQAGFVFEKSLGIAQAAVFDSLIARERLCSTGLGQGIAIPHGRIKGLKQASAAFLRLKQPISFDAPDGRPVNLLFVLLVPEQATEEHLQILSEVAERFSDPAFREALINATDAASVIALFDR